MDQAGEEWATDDGIDLDLTDLCEAINLRAASPLWKYADKLMDGSGLQDGADLHRVVVSVAGIRRKKFHKESGALETFVAGGFRSQSRLAAAECDTLALCQRCGRAAEGANGEREPNAESGGGASQASSSWPDTDTTSNTCR